MSNTSTYIKHLSKIKSLIEKNDFDTAIHFIDISQNHTNSYTKEKFRLEYSIVFGLEKLVVYFLDNGYEINYVNPAKRTPLDIALIKNRYNITKELLEHGAKINNLTTDAISCTINFNVISLLQLLLDYGLNVNYILSDGMTILMVCVSNRKINKMKLLIDRGADVNYLTVENQNALFYLNSSDNFTERRKIIDILIGAGIDLKQKDINGQDVFSYLNSQPSPLREKTLFFIKQAIRKRKIKQII